MEFKEGKDLDIHYNYSHKTIYHFLDGMLHKTGFKCIECGKTDYGEEYWLFKLTIAKYFFIEVIGNETNIIFNKDGDFITVNTNYYSILGVLVHHNIIKH